MCILSVSTRERATQNCLRHDMIPYLDEEEKKAGIGQKQKLLLSFLQSFFGSLCFRCHNKARAREMIGGEEPPERERERERMDVLPLSPLSPVSSLFLLRDLGTGVSMSGGRGREEETEASFSPWLIPLILKSNPRLTSRTLKQMPPRRERLFTEILNRLPFPPG